MPVEADDRDVAAVVAANTTLAFDLFQLVRSESGATNPVLGVHSISTAMTIALGGARGQTAAELRDVLGHTLDDATLHRSVAALDHSLRARQGGSTDLALANRVWLQDDLMVVDSFDALVRDVYDAGPTLLDFRTGASGAVDDANRWADQQTSGRIPHILGEFGGMDRLRWLLLNATYFNAQWAHPFDPANTNPRPFDLVGATITVEMMAANFDAAYASGSGWRSVRLPYFDGGLSMVVVVPDELDAFVAGLDVAVWSTVLPGPLGPGAVAERVEMPAFSARWTGDLVPAFEKLGVRDAFGCDADFSGVFEFDLGMDEGDTNIGFVQHEAFIDVDEKGTEAAAVTAVGGFQKVSRSLDEPEPIIFRADRPFLYAIVDDLTGAILFLGEVTDPRVEAAAPSLPTIAPRLCG